MDRAQERDSQSRSHRVQARRESTNGSLQTIGVINVLKRTLVKVDSRARRHKALERWGSEEQLEEEGHIPLKTKERITSTRTEEHGTTLAGRCVCYARLNPTGFTDLSKK
ncbi:unnamed protein product [Arctogadus glacialis]